MVVSNEVRSGEEVTVAEGQLVGVVCSPSSQGNPVYGMLELMLVMLRGVISEH